MKRLITAMTFALCLPACTTFDAYTGEKKTSKTTVGASIGASVAAVVAYLDNKDKSSRKRNERVLAAAAGGAAIGGSIGYYMDKQEAKLRQKLRGTGVSVERVGDNINLIMPGNITFASNSANIQSQFYEVLNSVVIVLNEFNKTIIVVSGHTDSTGSDSLNQRLSEQRANSVASYFRSQSILSDRLDTVGFGETQPVADNGSTQGRQLNRRVEITLVPIRE